MEFVLGNQLANKLAEYDPALKLFVKQNKSKPDNTQKNYKLGIIPDLIPLHIIDQQRQLYAINHINTQPAPDRFWVFNDDPCLENLSIKACLYYWQSRWCAVWFPNQDEDYIYGITLAFRDTDSKRSKLSAITFSMINTILEAGITLNRPKRWRLSEFHDHVSKIAWKVKNKNVLLPQDLFPEPIKIEYNNIKWTLFQPKDTHELASWGRTVRNCVGNSKNYSQSVLDKKLLLF